MTELSVTLITCQVFSFFAIFPAFSNPNKKRLSRISPEKAFYELLRAYP
jgi:hypothetical protein